MSSAPEHTGRREETAIAGPSFLGLSDEPPERYHYLLEEDEPRHGYVATYLVILVLLAAVVGGALKWRTIRDYLASIRKAQPAIATEKDRTGAQNSPQADASGPPQLTAEAAKNPAAAAVPQPAAEPEALPPSPPGATHDTVLGEAPPPKYPPSTLAEKAVANIHEKSAPESNPAPPSKPPAASATDESDDEVAAVPARPKRTSAARPVPKPAEPDDRLLILGENYLYGRTVRRDCAQAVVYLKAAASARNPQAMGHLGAMYSTGQCVPLDRATAYRWFTLAQQADPQNPWIERNRQMLWRQMSAAEQQRASGER